MLEKNRDVSEGINSLFSRRQFMTTLTGLSLPLITGCGLAAGSTDKSSLVVGLCDALCKQTASECVGEYAQREYAGLGAFVKSQTGIELRFRHFKFDQQLVEAAGAGKVDALISKTWTALRASRAGACRFERLADIPGPTGASLLRGVFVARADSSLKTVSDIDGRSFALGSEVHYESSFEARRALAQAGVKPAESVALHSCLNVAALVWERQVDAGVVSDYCVGHSGLQLVGDAEAFRVLGRTPGVPFVTFAVRETVPRSVRRRLETCLLELSGTSVPEDLHTTGLITPIRWMPEELERI